MAQRRLSHAQENPVTAIDIVLEPDATMVRQAEADNARLLKAYPEGFRAKRLLAVTCLTMFLPFRDRPQTWVKPRKSKVVPSVSG